jgi:hypothetical protein
LKTLLKEHDYFKVKHIPGLFKRETRPISCTLTIYDFGEKCIDKEHTEHLMLLSVLGTNYTMEEGWKVNSIAEFT